MTRYILTGAPGCGKTSIIQELAIRGYSVIKEAATDIIAQEQALGNAEPWNFPDFIEKIVALQKQRQHQTDNPASVIQFYDRSPICTYALATYLKFNPPASLIEEIERINQAQIYEKNVFYIEPLGFITPTDARKISFEESLVFDKIHHDCYLKFGYRCIKIPAAPITERVETILRFI